MGYQSCPKCGCTEVIVKSGTTMYTCGFYRSFGKEGKCTGSMSKLPATIKPRVRVTFDGDGFPDEVRIVMKGTRGIKTEVHDDLDGMIQAEVDDKHQLRSLRLDCNKLGGKEYEVAMLELMAAMKRFRHQANLPQFGTLARTLQKCNELVGEKRIDAKNEAIMKEKTEKWGNLHELLQKLSVHGGRSAIQKELQNLINDITDQDKKFAYIDEAIRECMDEYRGNEEYMSGRISGTIVNILHRLDENGGAVVLNAYYDRFIADRHIDYLHWYFFLQAYSNKPTNEYYGAIQKGLEMLTTVEVTEETTQRLSRTKKYLVEICETIVDLLGPEEGEAALQFLETIAANDPQPDVKSLASDVVNIYKPIIGNADGPGEEIDEPIQWNDE